MPAIAQRWAFDVRHNMTRHREVGSACGAALSAKMHTSCRIETKASPYCLNQEKQWDAWMRFLMGCLDAVFQAHPRAEHYISWNNPPGRELLRRCWPRPPFPRRPAASWQGLPSAALILSNKSSPATNAAEPPAANAPSSRFVFVRQF